MISLKNWLETQHPNIYHFLGVSKNHYSVLFNLTSNEKLIYDDRICIMTCASDLEKSPLINQLNKNNISYINAYEPMYYTMWNNTLKITYIINKLLSLNSDKIVLILDGYDVAIKSFEGLYDKFISTNKRILYNATKHNYPNIDIDHYSNRDIIGDFKYFNAGCCIGYVEDLIKFYEGCLEQLKQTPTNYWNSEQYIVRRVWAMYSEDPDRLIDFDYDCNIFQTFGSTHIEKIQNSDEYKVV